MAVTTAREALLAAAEEIEQRGWYQGNFYASGEQYDHLPPMYCPKCVMGALSQVLNGHPVPDGGREGLYFDALRALEGGLGVSDAAVWNDQPERTLTDVLGALRAAAEAVSDQ